MRTKYIVLDDKHAVMFGETLTHQQVAAAFRGMEVTGAGFVHTATGEAYGHSTSLKMGPGWQDDACLKFALGMF